MPDNVPIRVYVDHIHGELAERIGHVYRELQSEMDRRFAAQEAAEKVASGSLTSRLNTMNEFRQALGDQAGTFVPRSELSLLLGGLNADVDRNSERLNDLELRVTQQLERLRVSEETQQMLGSRKRVDLGIVMQAFAVLVALAAAVVIAIHP